MSNICLVRRHTFTETKCNNCGFELPFYVFLCEGDANRWYTNTIKSYQEKRKIEKIKNEIEVPLITRQPSLPFNAEVNNETASQKKSEKSICVCRWVIFPLAICFNVFLYMMSLEVGSIITIVYAKFRFVVMTFLMVHATLTSVVLCIMLGILDFDENRPYPDESETFRYTFEVFRSIFPLLFPLIVAICISLGTNPEWQFHGNGYEAYKAGNRDDAINWFSKAIQINPDYASAYFNRGYVYYINNDNDRAIADFSEVLRIRPSDAVAYNQRGIAYSDKGNFERAIEDFEAALRIKPKNDNYSNNLEKVRLSISVFE